MPDIGELVVGAWLTQVRGYDFVVYNQQPTQELPNQIAPTADVAARLGELDVIGLHTPHREGYLAECATDLQGLFQTRGLRDSIQTLRDKLTLSAAYADVLEDQTDLRPMLALWSPRAPQALVTRQAEFENLTGRPIDFVVNDAYSSRIGQLIEVASQPTRATGNDFYSTLQLLTQISRSPLIELSNATRGLALMTAADLAGAVIPWSEVVRVHKTQAGIRAPRGGSEA